MYTLLDRVISPPFFFNEISFALYCSGKNTLLTILQIILELGNG